MNAINVLLGRDYETTILTTLSLTLMRVGLVGYVALDVWQGYGPVYFGYNLWFLIFMSGVLAIIIEGPAGTWDSKEQKKDVSVLDKEINEMKSKLDELEKEKAKEVPDYSEYNKKMDEQPPVM